jgi:ribosomal protein S18 acetylase RimI-like enzyme
LAVEVVDIRLMEAREFAPLLSIESSAWLSALHWDYSPSARLISSCLADKRLPGYALISGGRVSGYCFFLYEGEKGLIGDLFVEPGGSDREHALLLLENAIETLKATPGLKRIEAQLPHFSADDLAGWFEGKGFQVFLRRFMALKLDRRPALASAVHGALQAEPGDNGHLRDEFIVESWERKHDQEAARLLYGAYRTHVDALINDQYQSVSGTSRLIENVVHLRGCGELLSEVSRIAIHRRSQKLAGILALTAVRPQTAHVPQVAVSSEFQRRGVGYTLMESSFRELERRGFHEVSLTVTDQNADAVRWYHRMGFETFRTFGAYVWVGERQ